MTDHLMILSINDFRYVDFDFLILGMVQSSRKLRSLILLKDQYDSSFLTYKGADRLATYLLNSGRLHEFFKRFNLHVYEHYQGLTPEELSKVIIPGIIDFFKNNQELKIIGVTKVHFLNDEVDERRIHLNFCQRLLDNKMSHRGPEDQFILTESIEIVDYKLLDQLKSLFKDAQLMRFNEEREYIIRYFRVYLTKGYILDSKVRDENSFIKSLVRETQPETIFQNQLINPSNLLDIITSFHKSTFGERSLII